MINLFEKNSFACILSFFGVYQAGFQKAIFDVISKLS